MANIKSIEVIWDDRKGCEGWFARATTKAGSERDLPLDCGANVSDEDLAEEARREVNADALLCCEVGDDFPVTVTRG